MRALVTGIAGFIGSAIGRRLLADGVEVRGIDAFTDYYSVEMKRANAAALTHAELVEGDLTTLDLTTLLDGVDVVFHQAGQPGVRASWGQEFALYTQRNVLATQLLLEAIKAMPVPAKLVAASSSSVYGDAERYPTSELDRPMPVSPYGVTKLAAEHLVTLYGRNFGLPTVSLRYFTVYGPGQRPDMAFNRFTNAAIAGRPIEIYGDGLQVRDFTYVDDVVEANLAAARTEVEPGEALNVAGGSSVTVRETLETLEAIHGRPLDVRYVERMPGDARRTGADTSRIESLLGWHARVPLVDGLRREYEYFASLAPGVR